MRIVKAAVPESQSTIETRFAAGHDSARNKRHCAAILQYFRELRRNLSDKECPSTLELIRDGRFGQRPPNRVGELTRGEFDGQCYDFERINCGRGEYRWRLHWPNRPGYPKNKNQGFFPLSRDSEDQVKLAAPNDWYVRATGKPRPVSHSFSQKSTSLPLFDSVLEERAK